MSLGLIDKQIQAKNGPTQKKSASLLDSLAASATSSAGLAALRVLQAATGIRLDPAPAYLFYVELSGLIVGLFTECSGLSVSRDVQEITVGGQNQNLTKLPGRVTYSNITLSRGVSVSRVLWDWFQTGVDEFDVKRLNFSIIQGAPGHNAAAAAINAVSGGALGGYVKGYGKAKHWDVEDAYPIKWEMSALSSSEREAVAIETLEIAHHGITLSYEAGTPMSLTAGATDLFM